MAVVMWETPLDELILDGPRWTEAARRWLQ